MREIREQVKLQFDGEEDAAAFEKMVVDLLPK